MNNLLTAIYSKISGSAFSTDIGGRVYLDQAPDNTEFPYCIYFVVSNVPADTFEESLEDILIQFSLFSASSGATEITTMYTDLKALFDNCSLNITSNTFVYMLRQNLTTMIEDITVVDATQRVKHWAVDYGILLTKP